MRVYDGIRDYDVLCYIALLAQTMPSHSYALRPRRRWPTRCGDALTGAESTG
jgi:hypothetical protein